MRHVSTGKTTTPIRRLGQKLDQEFLEEDEKELVETSKSSSPIPHAKSWLMFTPTELLKQYLKEAFAREGIAASDQRIKTWQDLRHDLARNVFADILEDRLRSDAGMSWSFEAASSYARRGRAPEMCAHFEIFTQLSEDVVT